ncbi:hypothetical protein EHS25_004816 [Saitozyma podzolica]|uniref:Rhodopsin domain-containing protein n=1 Tax=Saitozyma podzolica TaxID=1890683 RepID=A0A427Y2U8_9TREE|nr:hypothetical protein EHS25_004816 [Saitozyma podzolica]
MEVLNNRGPTVFVVTIVLIILATVFIVLRLISKWGVTRKATSDDFVVIIAWLFAIGLSASIMIGTQIGLGAPDSEILPQWYDPLKRCVYSFTVLYNPALMSTKTAILILYHRLAAAHPFLRYASLFVMAVVNISGIVLTFLSIFQCHPISAAFTETNGTCIDIVALYLSSAPINVLTDLAILLLPLPILTSLRIEFRQKVILVATFIVGGFVAIVDVVRIVYLQEALKEERQINPSAPITATTRPANFTYHASFALMWSAVEVCVGIMCCCVLVLKPLVMRVMPKLLRAHHGHHHPNGTPESLLRSDIKDSRSLDRVHIGEVPGPPLSTSITHQIALPVSPRAEMSHIHSPMSPRPPTMPSIPEQPTDDEDGTMDFLEMLASEPPPEAPRVPLPPLEEEPTRWPRRSTILFHRRDTAQTSTTQEPSQNFFDFVNIKSKVPLTQLSAKEAWWPIMFVSILFFLWGFTYGLIGTLNMEIQNLLGYTPSHTIALHNAYWAAYFFGPLLVGYWVLKYQGFKATFMTGLAIYATGAMSFWPSSVLRSYAGFFISNFIVALGLTCVESVAANLFIALAGPGELSEARLNFAHAIQAVGSFISSFIAQKALFSAIDQEDLFRVQWCYLAVALFVVFLAIIFYYVPLSEAGDDNLEAMALQRLYNASLERGDKAFGIDARHLLLCSGICMMMIYAGAQEAVWYFWTPLVQDAKPGSDAFGNLAISHAAFAFGRFLAAGLCYFGIPPRISVGVFTFGAFVATLLAMVLPQGSTPLAMLILITFFEAPLFPTMFAIIIRGQGKHTKFASAALIMAAAGGAIWPSIAYVVDQGNSRSSLIVTVVLWGVSMLG